MLYQSTGNFLGIANQKTILREHIFSTSSDKKRQENPIFVKVSSHLYMHIGDILFDYFLAIKPPLHTLKA